MKVKTSLRAHEIQNRRAYHDYFIIEKLECGISLKGNEVKSILEGSANITESWCAVENGQLIIHNMFVAKYRQANDFDVEERRDRVLLVHKSEIRKLNQKLKEKGLTIVPLRVYYSDTGKVKLEIGLVQGKHSYDKRESLKAKQVSRDIDRATKHSQGT